MNTPKMMPPQFPRPPTNWMRAQRRLESVRAENRAAAARKRMDALPSILPRPTARK